MREEEHPHFVLLAKSAPNKSGKEFICWRQGGQCAQALMI